MYNDGPGGQVFLKHIEIHGFKSFADKTVIEFSDGITALLGPNGCGKSNIVDAIKWVLGEQSVRNMRAERMDDVIFSGTEDRKSLSFAEVTLVIANDTGILVSEHPEIAIKRRIFREGDSEYFLNGTSVRLKEIRELFFDTGIGKSAYSIMEQGRIDQVLSNKPEDRRHLFEEAAGITKFRMRGSEAERKLVLTEENIVQVENILKEVRRSYETLKKQTEQTREYRRLRETLFELERDIKLLQWKGLERNRDKYDNLLTEKSKKHSRIIEKIDSMKTALADELDSVNSMESSLIESQKQVYGIDLEKENQERMLHGFRERRNEAEEVLEAAGVREKNVMESLKGLAELKKAKEVDLEEYADRMKEIENNIISCRKTIQSADLRMQEISGESTEKQNSLVTEENAHEKLQDELHTLTDNIVLELDKHLGEATDSSVRRNLGKQISDKIDEMRIRVEGRSNLLIDQKKLADGEEALTLVENTAAELVTLTESLIELGSQFNQYKGLDSDFLEGFLTPEGIITQKRELDEKIIISRERTANLKEYLSHLGDEKNNLVSKVQKLKSNLEGFRVSQARTITQAAALEDALASLAREVESEEKRLNEIHQQQVTEKIRIKNLDNQIEEQIAERNAMNKTQEKLRKSMVKLESGISKENSRMTGREVKLKALTAQRASLDLEKERIQLELKHINEEEQQLLFDFQDRHSRDLNNFVDMKETVSQSSREIREQQTRAKKELKSLGHVNLMAPEEFTEVSERYNFLCSQLSDLKKGREDLSRITEEIHKESTVKFLKTYQQIQDNFHEMFRRLFGGGKAELRLLNQEDPLNSGVEIYVQPPGKKLENIALLSGGEKSLCGIALLFATYLSKPSPFCILDEIDAALDEVNIQRFINVLVDFGKMSQFLIITHNKMTVTGAGTLLGVTMQESGVSRLLTLRLDGKEQSINDEKPV